jgi:hypothetical protein
MLFFILLLMINILDNLKKNLTFKNDFFNKFNFLIFLFKKLNKFLNFLKNHLDKLIFIQ